MLLSCCVWYDMPKRKGLHGMNQELIQRAGQLIAENTGEDTYCTLALIDAEGYPTASTITVSKAEGIQWLTFCTGLRSDKAKRIAGCDRASVCLNKDGAYNITLVGAIEILTDPQVKKEMWYSGLAEHFSGYEDPDYCVLRFQTRRYNLLVDWKAAAGTL